MLKHLVYGQILRSHRGGLHIFGGIRSDYEVDIISQPAGMVPMILPFLWRYWFSRTCQVCWVHYSSMYYNHELTLLPPEDALIPGKRFDSIVLGRGSYHDMIAKAKSRNFKHIIYVQDLTFASANPHRFYEVKGDNLKSIQMDRDWLSNCRKEV